MKLQFAILPILAFAGLVACSSADTGDDTTGTTEAAVRGGGGRDVRPGSHLACHLDSDCPSGEECRRHICQVDHVSPPGSASGSSSGSSGSTTCPPGTEAELEHGTTTCRPHGGHADAGPSVGASGAAGSTCTTDADCAPGLECEIEIEHGVTTSTCRAHGGR